MRVGVLPLLLMAGRNQSGREGRLLREALASAGRPEPQVGYIGAAHGDDPAFFARMAGLLQSAGSGEVRLAPLAGKNADPAAAREVLERADVLFMSGGDVEEGMLVLRRQRLIGFLREQHRAGKAFVGVSAGSIMLCRSWVRWPDPEDAASAEIFPCLGLAPILCDTHDEDGGWGELKVLLKLAGDGEIGYGIPSGGALRVSPAGEVEALVEPAARYLRRKDRAVRLGALSPGRHS